MQNPRKLIQFFQRRRSANVTAISSAGYRDFDYNGILRDPFGNPYIITLDVNYDNYCSDSFYAPVQYSQQNGAYKGPTNMPVEVMIWTAGQTDKAAIDPSTGATPKSGANKDNITSW